MRTCAVVLTIAAAAAAVGGEPRARRLLPRRPESGRRLQGFFDDLTVEQYQNCTSALINADTDGDVFVSGDEFAVLLSALGNPDLVNATTLEDTPYELVASFAFIGCLCDDCCVEDNATHPIGIDLSDLLSTESTNDRQRSTYIPEVCWYTYEILEQYEDENLTLSPTVSPSVVPTSTSMPSFQPSGLPTVAESAAPTSVPPTMSPTQLPTTQQPTLLPSVAPTISASAAPTISASVVPTTLPSATPTSVRQNTVPTERPTSSPIGTTQAPTQQLDTEVLVEYTIQVDADNAPVDGSYVPNLVAAMDILAQNVASEPVFRARPESRALQLRRRRLALSVDLPTSLVDANGNIVSDPRDAVESIDCPTSVDADAESVRCENITAFIGLFLDDNNNDDVQAIQQLYQMRMQSAIDDGDLQEALDSVDPDSPVAIVTAASVNLPRDETEPSTNSGGGDELSTVIIIAVVIAAVVFVGAIIIFALLKRKRSVEGYDDLGTEQQHQDNFLSLQHALEFQRKDDDDENNVTAPITPAKSVSVSAVSPAATSDDPRMTQHHGFDHSSYDGDSMYSDMYGESTEPVDTYMAAAVSANHDPLQPQVEIQNLGDVQKSLEKDRWLAPEIPSQYFDAHENMMDSDSSYSSYSNASTIRNGNWKKRMSVDRAEELERLVSDGNWEGVLAVSQMMEEQRQTDEQSSINTGDDDASLNSRTTNSDSNYESSVAQNSGRTTPSAFSESITNHTSSTAQSTTPTQKRAREEIRNEVAELIEKVVPDEADNIDEMMLSFKGREEELLETLRHMHEREIARKAKDTTNRIAKLEAREKSKQKRSQQRHEEEQGDRVSAASHSRSDGGTPLLSGARDEATSGVRGEDGDGKREEGEDVLGGLADAPGLRTVDESESLNDEEDAADDGGETPDEIDNSAAAAGVAEWAIRRSLNRLSGQKKDPDGKKGSTDE